MKNQVLSIILFLLAAGACIYCSVIYAHPADLMWTRYDHDLLHYLSFLTANFTHFDNVHLTENLIGLAIIWFLFYSPNVNTYPDKVASLLVSAIAVTCGIAFVNHTIGTYSGLSGALHGMFAYAAILRYFKDGDVKGIILIIGLIIKLYVDFNWPELTFNELAQKVYGETITIEKQINPDADFSYKTCGEAHLYGAIAGSVLALIRGLFFGKSSMIVGRSLQ